MKIEQKHLVIVNIALDQNPQLRDLLAKEIRAMFPDDLIPAGTPTPEAPKTETPPAEHPSKSDEMQSKILEWFKAHEGKHSLTQVRKDLGVDSGSKPFKNAIGALIESKQIHYNGKRGMGAEYWMKTK